MQKITIDKDHRYWIDDVRYPSVTEIINFFLPPNVFYTQEGRDNGHAKHEWFNFLSQDGIAENEPDARIAKAIAGYKKFKTEVNPVFISGEVPYRHSVLNYCGTPDVVFKLSDRLAVVDYKPKAKNKRTKLQTALYYLMLRDNGIMVVDRYELRLYDGMYRLEKHTDKEDMIRGEIMAKAYNKGDGDKKMMEIARQAAQFYK